MNTIPWYIYLCNEDKLLMFLSFLVFWSILYSHLECSTVANNLYFMHRLLWLILYELYQRIMLVCMEKTIMTIQRLSFWPLNPELNFVRVGIILTNVMLVLLSTHSTQKFGQKCFAWNLTHTAGFSSTFQDVDYILWASHV